VELAANGFLRHMVRIVVGTVLKVGRGRLVVSDLGAILACRDRGLAGPAAPPHGLYLESVWYAGNSSVARWRGAEDES
jgi:tRNA pseudouridine38-40 synthase